MREGKQGHPPVRSCPSVYLCNYPYVFATLVRGLPIRRQLMMATLTVVNQTLMKVSLGSNMSQRRWLIRLAWQLVDDEIESRGIGLAQVLDESL